ncbi:glycerophosphodiester phosphodiesterase [Cryobacterium sinapicolor]|uniref:glycerophosphodiester phosphodiesterase n=1 Tax=Cryobacterium sinapicolor TaxID=1259236 RepID=A0ABY2JGB8_9MICO|nr:MULTISPECIES: glycerophosphodiester phosphodiesterase family protein [Cryobacterium]TFC87923.1 glycerophosphodiester phosphodiesterase [Cryobacterium sp. TMT3-29-2]TFD03012.1 glycerophosphodiester phosphodiesterase [Cryobacterium sinapicolor]
MQPIVIGHRGASGYRPEHTRSAYELAVALGADAVEPDIVATRDGVLVVRHENEIGATTDVAAHPEFAGRRTSKVIDGIRLTGWFTEDFTWAELRTLRARERLPEVRKASATFDDRFPLLRLRDVFKLMDRLSGRARRPIGVVAELKHATYFESIGLPLDELFTAEVNDAGWNAGDGRLTIESFERSLLDKVYARGIYGKRIFLLEARGKPYDEVALLGPKAPHYADYLSDTGLYGLSGKVDGISVPKSLILATDADGHVSGASDLVDAAHAADLEIYCWTLRPENRYLAKTFRRGRLRADFGDWQAEFRTILGTGIDGVFADHPDLAVLVRDELAAED